MRRVIFLTTGLLWFVAAGTAWPIDQIQKIGNDWVRGNIENMSPTAITLSAAGTSREIPVNEIKRVTFENSPESLVECPEGTIGRRLRERSGRFGERGSGGQAAGGRPGNRLLQSLLCRHVDSVRRRRDDRGRAAIGGVPQGLSQQLSLLYGLRSDGRPLCDRRKA